MSGLMLSARDKLMFVMCLTLILFIGVIAVVAVSPMLGIMLILFDFLLAVILLLSGTKPEVAPTEGTLMHHGRYPAAQPGNDTAAVQPGNDAPAVQPGNDAPAK